MRVLVTFASKHGSTHEIAEAIAAALRAENLTVDLKDAADVKAIAGYYDAVIFGSAVYAGSWLPEAKQLAERQHAALASLPVWLFSSGPIGGENPQPHDDPAQLAAPLGEIKVRDHHVFVGKLDFAELGFAERFISKAVRAQEGDFRDWDDVRKWARKIAAELQRQALIPVPESEK